MGDGTVVPVLGIVVVIIGFAVVIAMVVGAIEPAAFSHGQL